MMGLDSDSIPTYPSHPFHMEPDVRDPLASENGLQDPRAFQVPCELVGGYFVSKGPFDLDVPAEVSVTVSSQPSPKLRS